MSSINHLVTFPTDCASLLLYDPGCVSPDRTPLAAARDGQVVYAALGGDGVYKIRITDGDLTQDERDYAASCLRPLGLKVRSGRICVSGYGFDDQSDLCLDVPPGDYSVALYGICHWESPRWWRDELQEPEDAPADYVAVLTPQEGPLAIPEPLLLDYRQDTESGKTEYLFGSTTRLIGPHVGIELVSTVRVASAGLVLKDCGPASYRATLVNNDGLSRSDQVRFRVISVNHEQRSLIGELISKR